MFVAGRGLVYGGENVAASFDFGLTDTHYSFVPFGRVVQGMEVADALFDGYGEDAGGGIRAGKQQPVFDGGNDYLKKNFPKLDYIKTARVAK
ncbi:MAG: hypothetical protein EBU23_17110 [Mycobacteriaceae bacterium]|nr:hypothetical protein [Mycobacteriaceae bacterium]